MSCRMDCDAWFTVDDDNDDDDDDDDNVKLVAELEVSALRSKRSPILSETENAHAMTSVCVTERKRSQTCLRASEVTDRSVE